MSLRIVAPPKVTTSRIGGQSYADDDGPVGSAGAAKAADEYLDRLVKLVPAESISAYPLLAALAKEHGVWAIVLVAWILLGVTVFVRWKSTADAKPGGARKGQVAAVAIAAVSFVIWVHVMEGSFGLTWLLATAGLPEVAAWLGTAKAFLSVVALVVWTIVVPYVYKGTPRDGAGQ